MKNPHFMRLLVQWFRKNHIFITLAGLDNPVSGSILYSGEDIRKKGLNYHRRHNVSLVFQNYNLIDYLTTEENVKLGGTKNAEDLLQKVSIPREIGRGMYYSFRRTAAACSDCPCFSK